MGAMQEPSPGLLRVPLNSGPVSIANPGAGTHTFCFSMAEDSAGTYSVDGLGGVAFLKESFTVWETP